MDSDESCLSDFIATDDENETNSTDSEVDDEGNRSSNGRKECISKGSKKGDKQQGLPKRKRRKVCLQSSESSDGEEVARPNTAESNMTDKKDHGGLSSVTSELSESSDGEEVARPNTAESSMTDNKDHGGLSSVTRPRSVRVQNLATKHKTERHKVLGHLVQKRQSARLEPKERITRKQEEKVHEDEQTKCEERCLWEDYNECDEDEDENDFIVPDNEVSDDGMNSDVAVQFMKLLNTFACRQEPSDELENHETGKLEHGMMRRRRKRRHSACSWRRIRVNKESDEGEESDKKSVEYPGLHTAVLEEDQQAVEDIVRKDPECINIRFREKTALHFAAAQGNYNMVKFLLTSGAHPTMYDSNHMPPIAYAANGHPQCLKLILKHTDTSIKSIAKHMKKNNQGSLLHFSVTETRKGFNCESRVRCLDILFSHDRKACEAMLEYKDSCGFTPLVGAVNTAQYQVLYRFTQHLFVASSVDKSEREGGREGGSRERERESKQCALIKKN